VFPALTLAQALRGLGLACLGVADPGIEFLLPRDDLLLSGIVAFAGNHQCAFAGGQVRVLVADFGQLALDFRAKARYFGTGRVEFLVLASETRALFVAFSFQGRAVRLHLGPSGFQ
jgi:hypothetical protein